MRTQPSTPRKNENRSNEKKSKSTPRIKLEPTADAAAQERLLLDLHVYSKHGVVDGEGVDQTTGTKFFSLNKKNLAGIYPKYENNSIKPGIWRGSNNYEVTDLIDACLDRYGTLENFLKTQAKNKAAAEKHKATMEARAALKSKGPKVQAEKPIKTQRDYYEPYEEPAVGTRWAPPDDSPFGYSGYYY